MEKQKGDDPVVEDKEKEINREEGSGESSFNGCDHTGTDASFQKAVETLGNGGCEDNIRFFHKPIGILREEIGVMFGGEGQSLSLSVLQSREGETLKKRRFGMLCRSERQVVAYLEQHEFNF